MVWMLVGCLLVSVAFVVGVCYFWALCGRFPVVSGFMWGWYNITSGVWVGFRCCCFRCCGEGCASLWMVVGSCGVGLGELFGLIAGFVGLGVWVALGVFWFSMLGWWFLVGVWLWCLYASGVLWWISRGFRFCGVGII